MAWGDNSYNQGIAPAGTGYMKIAAGTFHGLGIGADSAIVAWGWNNLGQCDVPWPNTGFVEVAAGQSFSLGLKSDGSIVAWGSNYYGECTIPAPNADFVAIAAGVAHGLGLKSDGSVVTWGNNEYGQCSAVPGSNSGFVAVAAGFLHNLALRSDGSVVAWGNNNYLGWPYGPAGQCDVPAPNSNFVGISGGEYHSLGVKSDGTVVAWGDNSEWQLNIPSPNTGFVKVAAGRTHCLGLKSDGRIVGWGRSNNGQLNVPYPNSRFVAIAAGAYHSLGLKGSATCAGLLYRDDDGDCVRDPGEPGLAGWTVILDPGGHAATTGADGRYSMIIRDPDHYTLRAIPYENWTVPCPAGGTRTFDIAGSETLTGLDFGLVPTPGVHDLRITVAGGRAKRGFTRTCAVALRNIGTMTEDPCTATLTLPPEVTYVDCSDGGVYDALNNSVTWTASMSPGDVLTRTARMEVPAYLSLGTPLVTYAAIEPSALDSHPTDNLDQEVQLVVGSWDPNDKQVSPDPFVTPDGVLTYKVNFQNVGTDTAATVVLRDTLAANLDMATVVEGVASHPYTFTRTNRELRWTFLNIGLPDSTVDPTGSNGFVKFTVRPKPGLPDWTVLNNQAAVYFDFNEPVLTNIATAYVIAPAAVGDRARSGAPLVKFGNPYRAGGRISLASLPDEPVKVSLYDVSGRMVSRLFEGRPLKGGVTLSWNGRMASGATAKSGIYYLSVRGERVRVSRGLVLIR
ncbi:MAG: hypothetical protein HZB25_04010 [Candidatus Eisenbacteria bacterium]|nr:hypothetical protein [Candidatus Eisenbacteria bacterium]